MSFVERRQDLELRKKVSEMSVEEMRRALLTCDKTGIGNERAYEEADTKSFQVSIDVDSLGWVNDNLGHLGGDQLLRAVGQALGDESADIYHLHGDEFAAQFDDEAQGHAVMARVRERLAGAVLSFVTPAGTLVQKIGIGLSYGIDKTFEGADEKLYADKAARTAAGDRVEKGREPSGVLRRAAGWDSFEPGGFASAQNGIVTDGVHSGRVLSVIDGVATQKVDRDGRTVRHELSRLNRSVEVGEVLDLRYSGGRGEVNESGRGNGLSR